MALFDDEETKLEHRYGILKKQAEEGRKQSKGIEEREKNLNELNTPLTDNERKRFEVLKEKARGGKKFVPENPKNLPEDERKEYDKYKARVDYQNGGTYKADMKGLEQERQSLARNYREWASNRAGLMSQKRNYEMEQRAQAVRDKWNSNAYKATDMTLHPAARKAAERAMDREAAEMREYNRNNLAMAGIQAKKEMNTANNETERIRSGNILAAANGANAMSSSVNDANNTAAAARQSAEIAANKWQTNAGIRKAREAQSAQAAMNDANNAAAAERQKAEIAAKEREAQVQRAFVQNNPGLFGQSSASTPTQGAEPGGRSAWMNTRQKDKGSSSSSSLRL